MRGAEVRFPTHTSRGSQRVKWKAVRLQAEGAVRMLLQVSDEAFNQSAYTSKMQRNII